MARWVGARGPQNGICPATRAEKLNFGGCGPSTREQFAAMAATNTG